MHFHGGIWAMYIIGQALHVLGAASDTVNDRTVPGISSFREYFRRYGIAIVSRFFLLVCVFPYVVDNPSEFDLAGIAHGPVHLAFLSGIVGYSFDSIADHVFAILGIKQKLPPIPGIAAEAPAPAEQVAAMKPPAK